MTGFPGASLAGRPVCHPSTVSRALGRTGGAFGLYLSSRA